MSRMQKKCVIASTGMHLLLALVLFVGPGFLSSSSRAPDAMPVLDFVPFKTVDALVSGGGDPKGGLPAPAPRPQPQPQPQPVVQPSPPPEKVREPEPVKETAKPRPSEEESLEVSDTKKPRKIEISTRLVKRDTRNSAKAKADAEAKADAKAWSDAQRRIAREFGNVVNSLDGAASGATSVALKGPGGGGIPYANFLQAVKSVYARAWVVPDGVQNDEANTVASVTIARDGTVISSKIIQRSGDPLVDASVQATLDRVRYAAPLPDDAKEDRRTVTINFNVKARKALG